MHTFMLSVDAAAWRSQEQANSPTVACFSWLPHLTTGGVLHTHRGHSPGHHYFSLQKLKISDFSIWLT
jgi:hypothetical protein